MGLFGRSSILDLYAKGDVKGLAKYLRDERKDFRKQAARALGELKHPRGVEPLLEALKDEEPEVRDEAIRALGYPEARDAVEALIQLLSRMNTETRTSIAYTLGQIGDARAIPAILKLRQGKLGAGAWQVDGALVNIGPPALDALMAMLTGDKQARNTAAELLGRFGSQAVERLAVAAADSDPAVRIAALKAISKIDDPRAESVFLAATEDANPDVRLHVIGAMRKELPGSIALPILTRAIADPLSPAVRAAAVRELGRRGGPTSREPLIKLLGDVNAGVRAEAVLALAQAGDKEIVPLVIQTLGDENPEVRFGAVKILAATKDRRAMPALVQALSDDAPDVQAAAEAAIDEIGDSGDQGLLLRAFSTAKPAARPKIAAFIGRFGDWQTIDFLLQALRDSDPDVRDAAAKAMAEGRITDFRVVEPLIRAIEAGDPEVGALALTAMRKIDDPRVWETVDRARASNFEMVRQAAAKALRHKEGAEFLSRMRRPNPAATKPEPPRPATDAGSRFCRACKAALDWRVSQTMRRFSDITHLSSAGGASSSPRDHAGQCINCRDAFCTQHAPDGKCPLCGKPLS